jgi:hypothetical protein
MTSIVRLWQKLLGVGAHVRQEVIDLRIAQAVRAGEREAVALYLESWGCPRLAASIRNGEHMERLGASGPRGGSSWR